MKKPLLKPNGYGNCLQGFFKIPEQFKNKYKGDPNKIIYRSSWERKFMDYCCNNSNIIWWTSEYPIKYVSPIDGKYHNYFVDFIICVKRKIEDKYEEKIILIEVKPLNQTQPPKPTEKNKKTKRYINECKTFAVNKAKWETIKQICKMKKWEFVILTENTFNGFH